MPLAGPVLDRLAAWLDERQRRWPLTANLHLFINQQSATRAGAVLADWIIKRLSMSAQAIREDRILHEAHYPAEHGTSRFPDQQPASPHCPAAAGWRPRRRRTLRQAACQVDSNGVIPASRGQESGMNGEGAEAEGWRELRRELQSHRVSIVQTLQDRENHGFLVRPGDPGYAAIMHIRNSPFRDSDFITSNLAAMFAGHGMSIIDFTIHDGDFCVWFEHRDKASSLRRPVVTARRIECEIGPLAVTLGRRGLAFHPPDVGVLDAGYGPHGRLTVTVPGHPVPGGRNGTGKSVLDLGPWGWTFWHLGQWRASHSYTAEEEENNLGIAIDDLYWGITPPESYRFIKRSETPGTAHLFPSGYDVVAAIAATYFFAPFINAFMAKAGEDCYQALRAKLRPESHPDKFTSVIDASTDSELVFQAPLSDEAIRQLARIDPKRLHRRTAQWNQQTGEWEISRELRPKQPGKIFERLPPPL